MYPWEMEKFISDRNYYIGGDDLITITSIEENPQLQHIIFDPYNNKYHMWDKEGNYFVFQSMPYEEANHRGLIKKIEKNKK